MLTNGLTSVFKAVKAYLIAGRMGRHKLLNDNEAARVFKVLE